MTAVAPRPGDLAFVRGRDLAGQLICRVTGGCYSHVRIVASEESCIEAVPPVVRAAPLTGTETIVRIDYGSAAERQAALGRARTYLGHRYAYLSYLSDLLMFAGCPLELGWRGEVNCAQLAARSVGMGLEQDDVTPQSLYLLVTALAMKGPTDGTDDPAARQGRP